MVEPTKMDKSFSLMNDDPNESDDGFIYGHWGQIIPPSQKYSLASKKFKITRSFTVKVQSKA